MQASLNRISPLLVCIYVIIPRTSVAASTVDVALHLRQVRLNTLGGPNYFLHPQRYGLHPVPLLLMLLQFCSDCCLLCDRVGHITLELLQL